MTVRPIRQRSIVARAQQAGVAMIALAGIWWLWAQWGSSPRRALAGAALLWLGYTVVLGVEFVVLSIVGRRDGAPRPAAAELVRAWLAECWLNAVVFAWRQPFRWRAIPDSLPDSPQQPARRGVVLVHGFVCNRGFWLPWLRELRARGIPFAAVNLEPVFGSIDEYAPVIGAAVERVQRATGLAPVLVCHSMGGVAARAWLRSSAGAHRPHRVVTIGSPHQGTWFGRFSHAENGRQMALGSEWTRGLADALPASEHARFTCWYSNCDNMVFPVSTATLPGADNRFVRGQAHVELAFHPSVIAESLALVSA